jgi:GNAT superfamily N-acetyltransferase
VADPLTRSVDQLVGAWRLMCGRGPSHVLASADGIEYAFSGLPVPFFNMAALTGADISAPTLAAHGRDACAWAADKNVPWMFVVTHERLAPGVDATATLEACGLVPLLGMTGMEAQRIEPPARVPDGLELSRPRLDADCAAILEVNSAAYEMDLAAAQPLLANEAFWKDHFPVVGLTGGRAVATASVLMVDGIRYVALVATEPGQQRRGYADAAMRRALEAASQVHGDVTTVLHATDAGRPIYARMGYTPTSTQTVFLEQKFLGGH